MSPSARHLLQIWDQLVEYQGRLYRQFEKDDAVTLQPVLPASMREEEISTKERWVATWERTRHWDGFKRGSIAQ